MNKLICFLLPEVLFRVLSTVFVLHQIVQVIFQQIKRLPNVLCLNSIWNVKHSFVFQGTIHTALPSMHKTNCYGKYYTTHLVGR